MADRPLVPLPVDAAPWERVFSVFPLVIVGTLEEDGSHDLAPKHMAMPMSWGPWFGFVCSPNHRTWQNARRTGAFTVSYPRPGQEIIASLAASPRCGEADDKPVLAALPVRDATAVPGVLVEDCGLYLECRLERVVEDLGTNGLLIGKVVAAHAPADAVRGDEVDDADLLWNAPLLAYVHPLRFAEIRETQGFPLPDGFRR